MNETEKRLRRIEKEIADIYRRAYGDISAKWKKYLAQAEKKNAHIKKKWEDAIKDYGENSRQAKTAENEYKEALKRVTIMDNRFRQIQQDTAKKITQTNQIAAKYANGKMSEIYTLNYNETAKVCGKKIGYNFTLVSERTIRDLITDGEKSLLPKSKIDIPKDLLWNKKKLSGEVLQGILQGEDIPKISNRLQKVVGMNSASSVRNRRTMVTAAQNKGRLDQMLEQEKLGIRIQKEWLSTHDGRTRDSHARLDGERRELDEPFSNGLMEPGDPKGAPGEVYNCRCTLVYFYPDYQ